MVQQPSFTINSRAFDGTVRRSWTAELLETSDVLTIVKGAFDRTVEHQDLGIIRRGTVSVEYFWNQRWYNVFKFYEPEGLFRNFYCNVSMPPTISDSVIDYVDLDIDILVDLDRRARVLDVDEFRQRSESYGYPSAVKEAASRSVEELLSLIGNREFPFDTFE